MSVVPRGEEYITTLWNDDYSIIRAKWTLYESYVYAVVQSKAAVREAIEENGGLEEDDVDDTRSELAKAVDKGICCTGFQFTKITDDETHWYEGTRMPKGKGVLHKFHNGARIRLSRENAPEDERWNACIKIYRRGLQNILWLKLEKKCRLTLQWVIGDGIWCQMNKRCITCWRVFVTCAWEGQPSMTCAYQTRHSCYKNASLCNEHQLH